MYTKKTAWKNKLEFLEKALLNIETIWLQLYQSQRGKTGKFLQNDENKTELFEFISEDLKSKTTEKPYLTLTTKGECVLSSKDDVSVDKLQPSMQEEADTRIFLNLKDAADNGHKIAKIH